MKSLIMLAATFAASTSLLAADSAGKDDVNNAAQKLAAADNYSWTTTTENSQSSSRSSHGKTEKGGYTYVDFSMRDDTVVEAVVKGGKGAIKTEDGWVSLKDAATNSGDGGFNPQVFIARRMQNYKAPAAEAEDLAGKAKVLAKSDDVYSGDLTEEGVKSLMSFGRRGNGGQSPAVKNPKGSVKFWIKDGILTKYQYKVQGTINRNDEDVDIDRTTTVEIKDVGTTKITVPEEAKNKMS